MLLRKSIFGKMLVVYILVVVMVVFCLNLFLVWFFQDYMHRQQKAELIAAVRQVEELSQDYQAGEITMAEWKRNMKVMSRLSQVQICLYDGKGHLVFNSLPGFDPSQLRARIMRVQPHLMEKSPFDTTVSNPQNPEMDTILAGEVLDSRSGLMAISYVLVADVSNLLREILQLVWLASALVLVLAVPVLYWLSQHFTRPLRSMEELASRMAMGDFNCHMEVDRQDEIGNLAVAFNHMATDLAKVEKHQQEFLANVSHELRTPLTSVRGFVLGIIDGNIPQEKQEHYLSRVYSEVCRMSRLVDDLLDLARIRTGQVELQMESINLWEVCREVAEGLELLSSQRGIELQVELPEEEAMVYGDRCRIAQILVNLLDNAIKFTPPGGSVTLHGRLSSGECQVSVSDRGEGIDQKDIPRIFEQFYRGKNRGSNGTGLGLAICKLLAETHNGRITVQSSKEKGSTFTLHLPILQNLYN